MQTLNVAAGRTDKEYQAAEEQRRADLLADSRSDANHFSGPQVWLRSAPACFRCG
jgi:hypothetical protein